MVFVHASWHPPANRAARLVYLARSEYEYRHVVLPQHISCHLPQGRLLSEVKSRAFAPCTSGREFGAALLCHYGNCRLGLVSWWLSRIDVLADP